MLTVLAYRVDGRFEGASTEACPSAEYSMATPVGSTFSKPPVGVRIKLGTSVSSSMRNTGCALCTPTSRTGRYCPVAGTAPAEAVAEEIAVARAHAEPDAMGIACMAGDEQPVMHVAGCMRSGRS